MVTEVVDLSWEQAANEFGGRRITTCIGITAFRVSGLGHSQRRTTRGDAHFGQARSLARAGGAGQAGEAGHADDVIFWVLYPKGGGD